MLQGLGFSDPKEGIPQDGLDEIQGTQRDPSVGLDPVAEVLKELPLKDGLSVPGRRQGLLREPEIATQAGDSSALSAATQSALQGGQQASRVARRAKQVSRLEEARQLVRCHERRAGATTPANVDDLPVVRDAIQQLGQPLAGIGIGGLERHDLYSNTVQEMLAAHPQLGTLPGAS